MVIFTLFLQSLQVQTLLSCQFFFKGKYHWSKLHGLDTQLEDDTLVWENKVCFRYLNSQISTSTATPEEIVGNNKHIDYATKIACAMIATMVPHLQKSNEDYWPYEMNKALTEMLDKKDMQECYEVVKALIASKVKNG